MTRGYRTKQEHVAIPGVEGLEIRSLLDRQQFHDPRGHAERLGISSASWPLFGLLWPSGIELAARLALRPVTPGERILELGCGLALASLVGHRRGADVTASDRHPLAASFLAANVKLNHLGPLRYRHGHWDVASAASTRTGTGAGPGRFEVRGSFDLIIGSDLLYESDSRGVLAAAIARHASPTAEVWIVDPDRAHRAPFHRRMAAEAFTLREELLGRPATSDGPAFKGRLLVYRRDPGLRNSWPDRSSSTR